MSSYPKNIGVNEQRFCVCEHSAKPELTCVCGAGEPDPAASLAKAVAYVKEKHPLPRCEHGNALQDFAGDLLSPSCGCVEPVFPLADYYDCGDHERLTQETAEGAVEDYLEGWFTPGCDAAKEIRERGTIELICYRRREPNEEFYLHLAGRLLDDAHDAYDEEFCSASDGDHVALIDRDHERATPAMIAALKEFFRGAEAYDCERIAEYSLGAALVERWMRKVNPDWFETRTRRPS